MMTQQTKKFKIQPPSFGSHHVEHIRYGLKKYLYQKIGFDMDDKNAYSELLDKFNSESLIPKRRSLKHIEAAINDDFQKFALWIKSKNTQ